MIVPAPDVNGRHSPLPYAPDSERWVISALLQKPEWWPHCRSLEVRDFHTELYQPLFRTMLAKDMALDLLTLFALGQIQPEYRSEIASLADERIHLDEDLLADHIKALLEATLGRVMSGPNPDELYVSRARGRHDEFTLKTREAELRSELTKCLFNQEERPSDSLPVYYLSGVPVFTKGNIGVVTAHPKAGKTAAIDAAMAAAIALSSADTLGFSSANEAGCAVLHFDTEQSPGDHWDLVTRILRRAKVTTKPDWLLSYCLTGRPADECRALVKQALADACSDFNGIHSVFLDGVAEFVPDVNCPIESPRFVTELHGLAIKYNCPIIGVIHLNPSSKDAFAKTRGHLGSCLERKAESNLLLQKKGEITTIWSEKQRRAPILKRNGPQFSWSDEARMHLSVQAVEITDADSYAHEVSEIFRASPRLGYNKLLLAIGAVTHATSKTTWEKRFRTYKARGLIRKSADRMWERSSDTPDPTLPPNVTPNYGEDPGPPAPLI